MKFENPLMWAKSKGFPIDDYLEGWSEDEVNKLSKRISSLPHFCEANVDYALEIPFEMVAEEYGDGEDPYSLTNLNIEIKAILDYRLEIGK